MHTAILAMMLDKEFQKMQTLNENDDEAPTEKNSVSNALSVLRTGVDYQCIHSVYV